MIDVGGAALLGAAARNPAAVAAVSSPEHYPQILGELQGARPGQPGAPGAAGRRGVRHASPRTTPRSRRTSTSSPGRSTRSASRWSSRRSATCATARTRTRRGAFYRETTHRSAGVADATSLQGGTPSFNNLLDLDVAYRIASDYTTPTVVHRQAHRSGRASRRPTSSSRPTGGRSRPTRSRRSAAIVGVNRTLDGATAREIAANSYEAVIAPGFDDSAIGILRQKPGLELLRVPPDPTEGMRDYGIAQLDFKRVGGGLLVETIDDLGLDGSPAPGGHEAPPDARGADRPAVRLARRPPRPLERDRAGQERRDGGHRLRARPSRQVSVEIALRRAGDRARLSVMASDAYFPFPDGIQIAAQAGVTAIIQPGGSIRDEMAIEVADRHHLAMVFTGRRHFRH